MNRGAYDAAVVTSIDRHAYATLRLRDDRRVSVRSLDFKTDLDFSLDEPPPFDGNLDLVKGCLRRLAPDSRDQERGDEANRIQKVLEGGNIKLGSVVSNILGKSGRGTPAAPTKEEP